MPILEWLNTQAFGTYSFKKTNAKGKELLTQEFKNFDFGMTFGYSKAFRLDSFNLFSRVLSRRLLRRTLLSLWVQILPCFV